jgi:hypothetical protein
MVGTDFELVSVANTERSIAGDKTTYRRIGPERFLLVEATAMRSRAKRRERD